MSCDFTDQQNNIICKIIENELVLKADNIDIKTNSSCFLISSEKKVLLDFKLHPPDLLEIRKYNVYTMNGHVFIGKGKVPAADPAKTVTRTILRLETRENLITFDTCEFDFPEGLKFRFVNGRIQF